MGEWQVSEESLGKAAPQNLTIWAAAREVVADVRLALWEKKQT